MGKLRTAIQFIPLVWVSVASAADPNVGRELAASCAACHNDDSRAGGAIPPIAGLDKSYLIAQLTAFKNGTRPATVMSQLAKGYTDAQIEAIAAHYASQRKARK